MRIPVSLLAVALLCGCAAPAPSASGRHVTDVLANEQDARQHCLMLLRPYVPAGTPALESKLSVLPDAANGDHVLRLAYVYGSTNVRMDARCQYAEFDDGTWQFSRLVITPRYPELH